MDVLLKLMIAYMREDECVSYKNMHSSFQWQNCLHAEFSALTTSGIQCQHEEKLKASALLG